MAVIRRRGARRGGMSKAQGDATYVALAGGNVLTDTAGAATAQIRLNHYADGTGEPVAAQTYGIDIHNYQGAISAIVGHHYSSASEVNTPLVWLDNTGHAPLLKLKATENQTVNPGVTATGPYIDFNGYPHSSFTDGQGVSGSKTFGSIVMLPVSTDVGRAVIADQVPLGSWIVSVPTTTLAVSMNGLSLPQGTIDVASTTGFEASGTLMVTSSGGVKLITYTGITATSFTGCTSGSGTLSTGGDVRQMVLNANVTSTTGGIPFLVNRGAVQSNGYLMPSLRFVALNANTPWTFMNKAGITVTPLKVKQYSNTIALAINNQGSGDILRATSNSAETTIKYAIASTGAITTLQGVTVTQGAGTGSPESAVTAPVGSTWQRTDGGAATSFYVKESGSGNTGWVAK